MVYPIEGIDVKAALNLEFGCKNPPISTNRQKRTPEVCINRDLSAIIGAGPWNSPFRLLHSCKQIRCAALRRERRGLRSGRRRPAVRMWGTTGSILCSSSTPGRQSPG